MKAFTNVIKNPKSAIDFMMQDEYLKDRLTRGNMNEAMKNQIDNKLSSKLSLLIDYFSLNMRYGDLFNLTLGGKAYVDVLMSKGYTKTQAFELFRKKTILTSSQVLLQLYLICSETVKIIPLQDCFLLIRILLINILEFVPMRLLKQSVVE